VSRPRRDQRQPQHQPHAIEKDLHACRDCNRSRLPPMFRNP
jgi:hypothetical protein